MEISSAAFSCAWLGQIYFAGTSEHRDLVFGERTLRTRV